MPDREVKTIQDLIFYQYAKIIAKSAKGDMGLYTFFNKLNGSVNDPDLVPPPLFYKHTQNAAGSFLKP